MKIKLLTLALLMVATTGANAVDPFENESIDTYESHSYPGYESYSGTTTDGDYISGQSNDYGNGMSTDTWTRTDDDGNSSTTHCESYSGNTYCN